MKSTIKEIFVTNLVLFFVHAALAQKVFKVPANPAFSDDVTDYDDPANGIDYYDVKDYPLLQDELKLYRKTKPGGLLSANEKSKQPNKPPKASKPPKNNPMTTPRSPKFPSNPKNRNDNTQGRQLIDGSDPNTDLIEILRQRNRNRNRASRRPAASPPQPGQTLRDMVGNEIKPVTASNQFFIEGTVARCRWTKSETVTHKMSRTDLTNPDVTVTGVTIEAPRRLKNIITHRFQLLPNNGGGKMIFLTVGTEQADLKVNWYSCGTKRKQ